MSINFSEDAQQEVVTSSRVLPEDSGEGSLRPRLLRDYTGQEKAKENLQVCIDAARLRGEPLDHVLLYGPPGLGKTTMAAVIANEMGVNMRITSGPAIEKAGDLAALLTNLQENDIVNMGLARMVDAPVLLVGDIDRGGVFAQLYGTVALQSEEDRRRIKGVVVNKFRGDRAILEPGLKTLEELCGVPVAGVVPYLHVDIDDEDSLSERFGRDKEPRLIDIAVIRLPRISNFTDFSPFERYENVSLRYVERARDLRAPDMIVIPGTKSTIADLQWLRQSGLEASIQKAASGGTLVFGVCGGYQMLGRHISDPEQVEAAGVTEIDGMGLLPLETVFQGEKVQTQTNGTFSGVAGLFSELNGKRYAGYEIHMGRSEEARGALFSMGNVYGSYVHGIFDEQEVADTILKALCTKKGVSFESLGTFDARAYKERQYDLLADAVRAGLDMPLIYRILNQEV